MYPQPFTPQPVSAPPTPDAILVGIIAVALVLAVLVHLGRPRLSRTAHGTAAWMSERELGRWGLRAARGLVLGRSLGGRLLHNPRYVHTLLVGGTGSGKGVGTVVPNLLEYRHGSVVVFDTKGELYQITARRRGRLGRVVNLDPFGAGARWNPLDTLRRDDPLLLDHVRAMGYSLVVPNTRAHDPHWDERAAQVVIACLTLVAVKFPDDSRNLNSVYEMVCDVGTLRVAATTLQELGGIPASRGASLGNLFEHGTTLTKEGASVVSTAVRHLDFLSSPAAAASVAASDFDPGELLRVPGNVLFLTIPESQLVAQQGLLRCWTSTLLRLRGGAGTECLMLLDEASALGALPALEEALVRGRSSGVRLLLAYQSDAQVRAAFPDKPTLVYDNTAAHVYLGASSFETAERISKSLGSYTLAVTSYSDNDGRSRGSESAGVGATWGTSSTTSVHGRPLLFPDEVLRLSDEFLIAFIVGLPGPVLARRIKYYADRHFRRLLRPWRRSVLAVALAVALALVAAAVAATANGGTPWTVPETPAPTHAVPPGVPPAADGPNRAGRAVSGR